MVRGVAVSRRVPLRACGAAAAAGAVTFFAAPSVATAEAAEPGLSPPECVLHLRDLAAKIASARTRLTEQQEYVARRESSYRDSMRNYRHELALYAMCRSRCASAGDAAGVALYEAKVSKTNELLQQEQSTLKTMRENHWQPDVDKCSDELAQLQRTHRLLSEYVREQHGAEWLAKVDSKLLSNDQLHKQAREWRSAEAPPSK